MSIHIQRFVDKLSGAESRGARDLVLPLAEAKALHQDITRLLITLDTLRGGADKSKTDKDEIVEIQVSGGSFK